MERSLLREARRGSILQACGGTRGEGASTARHGIRGAAEDTGFAAQGLGAKDGPLLISSSMNQFWQLLLRVERTIQPAFTLFGGMRRVKPSWMDHLDLLFCFGS